MDWQRFAIAAVAILVMAGLLIGAAKWFSYLVTRAAKQEERGDVMEKSLEAQKRFEQGRDRMLNLTRAERLRMLLERAKRRRTPR